jgi:serine/threonine-protein kinase
MVEPGQVLDGKYRIVRLIGEGGMGAVFEGENVRINRRVAIKVLHGAALSNAETVQRFEREAQAAGRIGSDHILEILDLGVLADGERYMVMEFLAGQTLTQRILQHGRLTPRQITPLMRQALVGLGAAHAAGIIHRDLKPDNLFVLNERSGIRDYVKIIDFGISKFNALGGDMSMTRTGAVMGTPYYMSPEQAKGSGKVDARSDLYAIGVILYEAVAGQVPFLADTFNELMFKIVLSDPKPLLEVVPDLDPRFAAIVSKAMARDADQRYGSAAEMIEALDAFALTLAGPGAAAPLDAPVGTLGEQRAALPMISTGQATQGSFATSQQGVPAATTSGKGPGLAIAAAAAVLVVVGGAFGAYKAFGGGPAEDAKGDHAPSATAVSALPPPAEVVQPAPKETAAVAPVVVDTPAVAPSAAVVPSAKPSAAPAAVAGRPRVAPRPTAAKPATTAGAKAPTPGKSSRDFGY